MRRSSLFAALAAFAVAAATRETHAAERWVDRPMTLPRLVFGGDVGIGIAHVRDYYRGPLFPDATGVGMNLEGAIGITDKVELGFRTGLRFGGDGRFTGADYYGRTLWKETYGTGAYDVYSGVPPRGGDTVANPELRVRWTFYSGSVAEVGLDGRVYMPVEDGTRFGTMVGLPLAFHVGDILRIDTGAYLPIVIQPPGVGAYNGLSFPAYFWFQATDRFWLGPMASLRVLDPGPGDHQAHLLLGIGMGVQVARPVDLKWWLLFPQVDDGFARTFGGGFGVAFRIGE